TFFFPPLSPPGKGRSSTYPLGIQFSSPAVFEWPLFWPLIVVAMLPHGPCGNDLPRVISLPNRPNKLHGHLLAISETQGPPFLVPSARLHRPMDSIVPSAAKNSSPISVDHQPARLKRRLGKCE